MMTKDERQAMAAQRWRLSMQYGADRNGRGCFWFDTGVGKTYTTLFHIVKPILQKNAETKIIILVHRIYLENYWENEARLVLGDLASNLNIITVQFLIDNQMTPTCDLLIVDEIDKLYSEEFIHYINGDKIKFRWNLGLTATYKDPKSRYTLIEDIYPVIDRIDRQTAIDNGWVSRYNEVNIEVELTEEEKGKYVTAVNLYNKFIGKFNGDISLAISMLHGDKHNNAHGAQLAYAMSMGYHTTDDPKQRAAWSPEALLGYASNVLSALKTRDDILARAENKFKMVLAILNKFKLKAMVFSESTKFADKIGELINERFGKDYCVVYHSQLESRPLPDTNGNNILIKSGVNKGKAKLFGIKTLRELYLGMFKDNKAMILSTARTLDEGFDCRDIRLGIITSRSNSFNQQHQREGRILRIIPESPDAIMLIINVFVKGTSDENKLDRAQKHSNPKWVTSLDDITIDDEEEISIYND